MQRRQFLAASSVGLAGAVAGCTDVLGGGSGGVGGPPLPEYHTVLPAPVGGEEAGFVHLDVARLNELTSVEREMSTQTPGTGADDPAVPLLAAPVFVSLFVVAFGLGFGLAGFGSFGRRLFGQFEGEFGTQGTPAGTEDELRTITLVGGVVVFEGEFDAEAYVESLPDTFAESASRDGFTVYDDPDDGSSNVVAISEATIAVSFGDGEHGLSSGASLGRVLDAKTGAGDRFADQHPDAGWALRTAGNHGFVLGGTGDTEVERGMGEDTTFDPLSGTPLAGVDASVLVSGASITIADNAVERATADTAFTHTSDPVERSDVEEIYAESEADMSVSVADADEDGAQRVSIRATFSDANL